MGRPIKWMIECADRARARLYNDTSEACAWQRSSTDELELRNPLLTLRGTTNHEFLRSLTNNGRHGRNCSRYGEDPHRTQSCDPELQDTIKMHQRTRLTRVKRVRRLAVTLQQKATRSKIPVITFIDQIGNWRI